MSKISPADVAAKKLSFEAIREWVEQHWRSGNIHERTTLATMPRKENYDSIPWQKVDCMLTKLIDSTLDGVGFGLDLFAPRSEEKSYMHCHPHGDRIATVLEGKGTFFALRDGQLIRKELAPGDVVYFPCGVPHAFWGSESESLLVHVALNPFAEFDDPDHTVPSEEGAQALRDHGLID